MNNNNPLAPKLKMRKVKTFLGQSIFVALLVAAINIAVGVLGILTYFQKGALYSLNIDQSRLSGKIINTSNIASLISGVATLLSAACTVVYSGLGRSWLLRKSKKGEPASMRQWGAAASGGGLNQLRKSPLVAGGILLITVLAASAMSATFAGILVPNIKTNLVQGNITGMPGYAGNYGTGTLISCIDPSTTGACAMVTGYGVIGTAMAEAAFVGGSTSYEIGILAVDPGPYFLASASTYFNGSANINMPLNLNAFGYTSVGLQISTSCSLNTAVGITSAGNYYFNSSCATTSMQFGAWRDAIGTFSESLGCRYDSNTYRFDYAIAGAAVYFNGQTSSTNPLAFSCLIRANEGTVDTVWTLPTSTLLNFKPARQLTAEELIPIGTALMATVSQDGAIYSKVGPVSIGMAQIRLAGQKPNMALASVIIAQGAAAAATVGYISMTPPTGTNPANYSTLHSGIYAYTYTSYGWVAQWSMLAWGTVAIVLGIAYLSAIIYMTHGGTRYDPTDFHQTLNTAAGSAQYLYQHPGTSTGAGLDTSQMAKTELWYGDMGNSHIGFSHQAIAPIQEGRVYV